MFSVKVDQGAVSSLCWRCRSAQIDTFFCLDCKAIQPFLKESDYFSCLGFQRRLVIDLTRLEEKYHDLSRLFHPDFYQRESPEEREISLESSAFLNKAYRVLKDPIRRIEYLLVLLGEAIETTPPADLFDEILTLQEAIATLKKLDPADVTEMASLHHALKQSEQIFKRYRDQAGQRLFELRGEWDAAIDDKSSTGDNMALSKAQRVLLQEMKQILSHRAYFSRVLDNVATALKG